MDEVEKIFNHFDANGEHKMSMLKFCIVLNYLISSFYCFGTSSSKNTVELP